jgi:hypothetical protein
MEAGSELIKVRSNSRQYHRIFSLNPDMTEVRWQPTSKKPHKARSMYSFIIYSGSWSLVAFYATAESAMWWNIAIHLYVCVCLYVCLYVCVLYRFIYSELKKSSCEKPLVQFQPNLAGLIFGWRASKVIQRISFHAEIWLTWHYKNKFKKSSCKDPKGLELRYF